MRYVHPMVLAAALCACGASLTSKAAPPAAQATQRQIVPSDSILYFIDGVRQATGKALRLEAAAIESLSVVKRPAARDRFGPQVRAAVFIYLKRAR